MRLVLYILAIVGLFTVHEYAWSCAPLIAARAVNAPLLSPPVTALTCSPRFVSCDPWFIDCEYIPHAP
jgi:hypothetical protein